MIDREKVIKGLLCCAKWMDENDIDACNSCPYHRHYSDDDHGCLGEVNNDAVALLREQEPRVMTLEEVKGMKRLTICAVEQRSKVIKNTFNAEYGGIVTINGKNFIDFGLYADTNRYRRTEARYGKSWRCWTFRPTDEQRQKVKWDD